MLITVSCTERDLLQALDLHHGRNWPENLMRLPGLLILAVWWLATLALALYNGRTWPFVIVNLLLVLWGARLGWMYLIEPLRVSRLFRRQDGFREVVRYNVDPTGLVISSARGETRVPWNQIHRWKRGRASLLLYHSIHVFNFIPTRALADRDLDDLVALLKAQRVTEERPRYAQLRPWLQVVAPLLLSAAALLAVYNAWRTASPVSGQSGQEAPALVSLDRQSIARSQ